MYETIGVFKDFKDNSLKTVFRDDKKRIIEMTLLFNKKDKDVVCVPTHNYCNLGCKMCHLTNEKVNKFMQKVAPEYAQRINNIYKLYQQSGASSSTRLSQYRKSAQELMTDIYGTKNSKNIGIDEKYTKGF